MKQWVKWVFMFSLVGLLTAGMGPDEIRAELAFSFVNGGGTPQSGDHNCSFADIDNDGIDELYTNYWPKKCYKYEAGSWYDISSTTGGLCSETRTADHGLVFFDVDNDGDYDFMDDDNYLYENDGAGFFSDLSDAVGLGSYLLRGAYEESIYPSYVIFRTRGVSAGDIDGDGDNDVWVTGDGYHLGDYTPPRNYLFINQLKETGTLSFVEDAANRGQDSHGDMSDNRYRPQYVRQGSMFFDYDDDGDLDLYITVNGSEGWYQGSYCCEAKNEMWENDGTGYFTEVAEARGIEAPNSAGGTNVGDLDNDGYLDVVVDAARIYRYDPINRAYVLEQDFNYPGFASCVGDFDHDGDLDIYPAGANVILENRIQERGWENGFVSRPVIAGGSDSWRYLDARGCAVADFDNDGDMDVYWTHMAEKPWYGKTRGFLLRNDLPANNNWLKVKLRGPHGDTGAPGAKVKIYQGGHAGDMNYFVARRDAISVQGYMDNHSQVLHFGLSGEQTYDVVVTFLTGETRNLSDVAPGQLLFVDAFSVDPGDDDTLPVISNIAINNISSSSATIAWLTNEPSDSQVEYGLTTSYGSSTALDSSLVTDHSVTLSGLNASTIYHYRVKSKDASGNLAVSGDYSFTTSSSPGGWEGYGYRRPITIDHTKVTPCSSDLSNFPVLVSLSGTWLKTTGNGGRIYSSSGYDIIFKASDGLTPLDHEVEKYDGSSGTLIAWVRIPTLDKDVDSVIYVCYGNATVASPTENPTGVWDSNYKAVYHLKETSGTQYDSTGNNNDSASVDVTTQGSYTGKINGADELDGTTDAGVKVNDHSTLDITQQITIEAWVKADSCYRERIVTKDGAYMLRADTISGDADHLHGYVQVGGSSYKARSEQSTIKTDGSYQYVVFKWDGRNGYDNKLKLYIDGSEVTYNTQDTYQGEISASTYDLWIGSYGVGGTESWDGGIDEVRISNIVRSSCWIKTSYLNQSNPSTFHTPGNEEPAPAEDTLPPVISNVASGGITASGATITWSTNEPSDSQVEYGLTSGYGSSSALNTSLVTDHSVTLSGLNASTIYHYRVKSKDAAGNLAVSGDYTFATAALSAMRINAGGESYADRSGNLWVADQPYAPGSFGYVGGSIYSTGDSISGTEDDPLYQTERWGSMSYWFDVPNGDYQVKLLFAEIYLYASNKRKFNVYIEGGLVLDDFDIYSIVGHDAALVETFSVAVSDGRLDIDFGTVVEDPKISAIEVVSF